MLQATCSALPTDAHVLMNARIDICDAMAYLYLEVETLEVILRLILPCINVQLYTRAER